MATPVVVTDAEPKVTWLYSHPDPVAGEAALGADRAAQRDYYRDPERVALRGVFDHMADYSIHPATQLLVS